MEDLYYCGPKLAGRHTNFRKLMNLYTKTSDPKYLEEALEEVLHRSNKEQNIGLQNRRNTQAEMLNSFKVPLYSKPNEDLVPNKPIPAKIGETIIPKNYSVGKEINPVSYTHLDVYKRQSLYNPKAALLDTLTCSDTNRQPCTFFMESCE